MLSSLRPRLPQLVSAVRPRLPQLVSTVRLRSTASHLYVGRAPQAMFLKGIPLKIRMKKERPLDAPNPTPSQSNSDGEMSDDVSFKSAIMRTYSNNPSSNDGSRERPTTKHRQPRTNKETSLVIFDKDGTLICFHSMWVPWALKIANNLEVSTGLTIADKVYDLLGYCTDTERVKPGLLAESTPPIIKERLIQLLMEEGMDKSTATHHVLKSWEEGDTTNPKTLKSLTDIKTLFQILQRNKVKIAICTADSREGTENTLRHLCLDDLVDVVVCGDDTNTEPKPEAHNALSICAKLGIDPSQAVMVGDTTADVGMGKNANLGKSIGVLSGVCGHEELTPQADVVVKSVKDILPHVLPDEAWKNSYSYSGSDRELVNHFKANTVIPPTVVAHKISLVIFDLNGTLICLESRWSPWLQSVIKKLELSSGLALADAINENLGISKDSLKIGKGILAECTKVEIKNTLIEILRKHGLYYEEAVMLVNQTVEDCDPLLRENLKSLDNLHHLFETLKINGAKIAVSTADSRQDAHDVLKKLDLNRYLDMMLCGDDPLFRSSSSTEHAQIVCKELGVSPQETVVVSDNASQLTASKAANFKASIGVLSGASTESDLKHKADYIIPSVKGILPHILKNHTKPMSNDNSHRRFSILSGNIIQNCFPVFRRQIHIASDVPSYSHIVVGAGSAGCVLANRLSADPDNSILLLEAGGKDNTWKIHMPAALMYNLCDDKYNWYYHTEPEKHMNNRVMYWPRGRVLGGSSSLNAMVYIRGHAYDYDRWEKEGASGWSYADCLPYFQKSQTHELGADEYRGGDGPLHVSRGKTKNPLFQAFIDAGIQAGYPFTADMNGYQQEGFGWIDMTIHKGKRWSTSEAYLKPARNRQNLTTETNTLVTKLLFEKNRAVGLEMEQGGMKRQVHAEKEVILSGGSINSPQLLMLSGIGNADDLRQHDIPLVAHLPGVGENLQDHLEVYVQQACTQPITLYKAQWKFPHNMVRIGLEWFLRHTGDAASTHLESGGFIRSRAGLEHPDIQFHFLPSVVQDHGRKTGDCHAYQVHVGPMRQTSRGHLKLKTNDPRMHPCIVANYMSSEEDIADFRANVRLAREIFAQNAFDPYRGDEIAPGKDCQTDEQIDEYIRSKGDSAYHPSCTCKMGQESDPMAVVDSETKVIGIDGLRVVDASIMPSIVSGNLNGPTIMIAEKAADIILNKQRLPKSNAPVWQPKNLDTQR